jgi:nucleotidyltransferase/DNA polymerase involved in DNA repair
MDFEIVSEITAIETIATGVGVRDRHRLRKLYVGSRWRKRKGVAQVRLASGRIRLAEVHWDEAHGVGKREFKLKLPFLD